MLQKTAQYMKEHKMAQPGERIVLGLSGGMDSVCLFHILLELGYDLEAVHVHHGIRGKEADRDEDFAKNLCEKYGVSFHSYHFHVPEIGREQHLSVEEAGRNVRRQAFLEVLKKTGADHIALAHHGNDRAETLLFHMIRGTGLKGLTTMKPCSGVYIRPLLWTERKEIAAFVEKHHYDYVEDETNCLPEYTRNKLRHQILPLLQEINPASTAHLCAAAEKLDAVEEYIVREAEKLEKTCAVWNGREILIREEPFLQGERVLQVPVLQSCISRLGTLKDFGEEHYEKIRRLFLQQTGKEVHLPGELAAQKSYEGVIIFRRQEETEEEPVQITGEGSYHFGGKSFCVSMEDWDETKNFPLSTYTKCFDYDKIKEHIFLRTRKRGDYLEINREGGRKSLQDYLVNEKVPKKDRERIPVLADGSHVLWVAGKRISEYYKVTKETKRVLKVQMDGGNEDELFSKGTDPGGKD